MDVSQPTDIKPAEHVESVEHVEPILTKNQKRRQKIKEKKCQKKDESKDSTPTTPAAPAATPPSEGLVSKEQIVAKAGQLWADLKEYAKNHPEFKSLDQKNQMEIFSSKVGYETFMNEFPIVSRYMICAGQFSMKAFMRFLEKMEKTQHPPADKRPKGYMEDQWIRRNADYAQYLWEAYQKRHFNNAERKFVWQHAYETLKHEFDDFRNKHKEVEERVKEEKKELDAKNARELIERVQSGKQKLSHEEELYLLAALEDLLYKKNFNAVLKQLTSIRVRYEEGFTGVGSGPDENQKITMIETVDVERMGEIDDKFKPAELRGMEPIIETEDTTVPDIPEVSSGGAVMDVPVVN